LKSGLNVIKLSFTLCASNYCFLLFQKNYTSLLSLALFNAPPLIASLKIENQQQHNGRLLAYHPNVKGSSPAAASDAYASLPKLW
jgi:hypothetical protein